MSHVTGDEHEEEKAVKEEVGLATAAGVKGGSVVVRSSISEGTRGGREPWTGRATQRKNGNEKLKEDGGGDG